MPESTQTETPRRGFILPKCQPKPAVEGKDPPAAEADPPGRKTADNPFGFDFSDEDAERRRGL